MPMYHSRIIIREINCGSGFVAENMEEAEIRLQEQLEKKISESTIVCQVEESIYDQREN
jgi:hypothetical protein